MCFLNVKFCKYDIRILINILIKIVHIDYIIYILVLILYDVTIGGVSVCNHRAALLCTISIWFIFFLV